MPAERPEIVALVLLAVALGLGILAIDTESRMGTLVHGGGQAGIRSHDRAPNLKHLRIIPMLKHYIVFSHYRLACCRGAHVVRP